MEFETSRLKFSSEIEYFERDNQGTKIQPKVLLTEVFGNPLGHGRPRLRVMDVRAEMLVFPSILAALTEVLGWDLRANDPRMSAGCPSEKLPLWADFSFLEEFF